MFSLLIRSVWMHDVKFCICIMQSKHVSTGTDMNGTFTKNTGQCTSIKGVE